MTEAGGGISSPPGRMSEIPLNINVWEIWGSVPSLTSSWEVGLSSQGSLASSPAE